MGNRMKRDAHEGNTQNVSREREFFIDNLLVRIHLIIVVFRWTGLAPWAFELPFPGSLTFTFLHFQTQEKRDPSSAVVNLARNLTPKPQTPTPNYRSAGVYDLGGRSKVQGNTPIVSIFRIQSSSFPPFEPFFPEAGPSRTRFSQAAFPNAGEARPIIGGGQPRGQPSGLEPYAIICPHSYSLIPKTYRLSFTNAWCMHPFIIKVRALI